MDAQDAVFNLLKELHNGYRFRCDSPATLFDPSCIQFVLSKVARFVQLNPNSSFSKLEKRIRNTRDPNSKPAEAVLHLMSSNPHTFSIIADCINNPNGISSNMTAIDYQIRPASMVQVDQLGIQCIITWMFFKGALTYAKQNATDDTLSFVIPNNVARREFIDEFLKFGPPDAHGKLEAALSSLLDTTEPTIDPFLRQIESSVLASARGLVCRDIKDREQAFHKAFLTCSTLCKSPADAVVSEYLVKANKPGSKNGSSVDVVYLCSSSENGKKRFVFEPKDVPVKFWKDRPPDNASWSQLADAARCRAQV
jgi:hypothetical protein